MACRLFTFLNRCRTNVMKGNIAFLRTISLISSSKPRIPQSHQGDNKLMNFYFQKLTRTPALNRLHYENIQLKQVKKNNKFHSSWGLILGATAVAFGSLSFKRCCDVHCEGDHHDRHCECHSRSHYHRRHRSPIRCDYCHHRIRRHRDEEDSDDHRKRYHDDEERRRGHRRRHHNDDNDDDDDDDDDEDLCERHRHILSSKSCDDDCTSSVSGSLPCDHSIQRAETKIRKFCSCDKYPRFRSDPERLNKENHVCSPHKDLCQENNDHVTETVKSCDGICVQMKEFDEFGRRYQRFDWELFWDVITPDLHFLSLAIASAVVLGFINVEIPIIVRDAVSILAGKAKAWNEKTYQMLLAPGLKLVSLYVAYCIFSYTHDLSTTIFRERLHYRLATDLFEVLLKQEVAFFDNHHTGEMVNRLTSDVPVLVNSFIDSLTQGTSLAIQIMGSLSLMYAASPLLTSASVASIPTLLILGKIFTDHLRPLTNQADDEMEKATTTAEESLGNIRTVRVLAIEETRFRNFDQRMLAGSELKASYNIAMGTYNFVWNISLSGLLVGLGYWGMIKVMEDEISVGEMVSFILAAQMLRQSLSKIVYIYEQYVEGQVSGARVFEYFHREYTIPLRGGDIIPKDEISGCVEFKNIKFTYPCHPDVPLFKDFNFKIPNCNLVVLCGKSGEGKSSLANLLVRFYDVEDGEILIDGKNIKTLDPEWLRGKLIGYIMQDSVLFNTSVLENIRWASPEATDEEVHRAAKLANADDFIRSWPHGYDTILGERGMNISGGQRKRLAIARALIKNPCIIIADEVTSALDNESVKLVLETLREISKEKTVLLLAHSGVPLHDFDIIASLDKGSIVEMGTPQEVMENKGFYYNTIKDSEQSHLLI